MNEEEHMLESLFSPGEKGRERGYNSSDFW